MCHLFILKVHCSLEQQRVMAALLHLYLGASLVTHEEHLSFGAPGLAPPSPLSLKRRVLLKCNIRPIGLASRPSRHFLRGWRVSLPVRPPPLGAKDRMLPADRLASDQSPGPSGRSLDSLWLDKRAASHLEGSLGSSKGHINRPGGAVR